MAGIYIHIPFCRQACHYCDFHFSTNLENRKPIVQAIGRELTLRQPYLARQVVNTIYFGGGTPSLLSTEEQRYLLNVIADNFETVPAPEITLEANPDDLTEAVLTDLRAAGFNRLSIGIQSFDDNILHFLNRAHNSDASLGCFDLARKAGFSNISIDLIYAIPGQDDAGWHRNIDEALKLAPEHLSAYALTIEEKTVFGRWSAQGKFHPAGEDVAARQLELLTDRLATAGYQHYEVSNFALPGYISQHNSSYWREHHYLGVGPSAHSFNGLSRQFNVSNNHLYRQALEAGTIPATLEVLSREDRINEYLLTTLRTSWGADLEKLKSELQYDIMSVHKMYVETLLDEKLACLDKGVLILTGKGKLLADKISSDLFATA
ncbi:MAG TPA: radical SAM family heme chaperone HemW [Ohtaekwangia sp.]|nr:radical SAM family heme chaperone HemW [Ohtaekwangia sp.]